MFSRVTRRDSWPRLFSIWGPEKSFQNPGSTRSPLQSENSATLRTIRAACRTWHWFYPTASLCSTTAEDLHLQRTQTVRAFLLLLLRIVTWATIRIFQGSR